MSKNPDQHPPSHNELKPDQLTQYFQVPHNELRKAADALNQTIAIRYTGIKPELKIGEHYWEDSSANPDIFSGELSVLKLFLSLKPPTGSPALKYTVNFLEPGVTSTVTPIENTPAAFVIREVIKNGGMVVPIDSKSIDLDTMKLVKRPIGSIYIHALLTMLWGSLEIFHNINTYNNKKMSRRKFLRFAALMTGGVIVGDLVKMMFDMTAGENPIGSEDGRMERITNLVQRNPQEWPTYSEVKIDFRNRIMAYGLHFIGNHLQESHLSERNKRDLAGTFGNGHVGIVNRFNENPEKLTSSISSYARNFLSGILELTDSKRINNRDAQRLVFESAKLFPMPEFFSAQYPLNSVMGGELKTPKLIFLEELVKFCENLKQSGDSDSLVKTFENAFKSILLELADTRIIVEDRIRNIVGEEKTSDKSTSIRLSDVTGASTRSQTFFIFSVPHKLSFPDSFDSENILDFGDFVIANALESAFIEQYTWFIIGCAKIHGLAYPLVERRLVGDSGQDKVDQGLLVGDKFILVDEV